MPVSSVHTVSLLRRCTRIAAALVWAGLIFAASARPDLRVAEDQLLDLVLRKAAHVAVFGILALLLVRAMAPEGLRTRSVAVVTAAWALTALYAISDEYHQTFVEGRVGHASDVGIDLIGATTALGGLWIVGRGRA